MLICDKCKGRIPPGAQFCPQCGDSVTEADRPETRIAESTVASVEIAFGKSSSAQYPRAVEICRKVPSYTEVIEGPALSHRIVLPITEVELLINVWELVGNWKSSRMLIDGQPASKSDLVYGGVGCFRSRQRAFKPEQYCFGEKAHDANIWGCKRLGMPVPEWGGGWLDFGTMDRKGVWHFDKERIRQELEAGLHEHRLCPVLDRTKALETLKKLPDTINPKVDKRWKYRTTYQEVNGQYSEVAVGIQPVLKQVGGYVIGAYKPLWESEEDDDGGAAVPSAVSVKINLESPPRQAPAQPAWQAQTAPKKGSCALLLAAFVATCASLVFVLMYAPEALQ